MSENPIGEEVEPQNESVPEIEFTPPSSLYTHLGISLAVGALLGAIFLFPALHRLAWVAVGPVFFLVRHQADRRNFLAGLCIGAPWFLISCHWLTHVTVPGLLCLALFQGVYLGIWLLLAGKFPSPWRNYLFPVLWVTYEFVRSKGPLGFSWNLIGHHAYPIEIFSQSVGVYGLSLILAGTGVLASTFFRNDRDESTAPMPEGSGTFLILPLIWMGVAFFVFWNAPPIRSDGKVHIGVVQGNFEQSLKWSVPLEEAVGRYVDLTDKIVRESHPDLVIWPEAALPMVLSKQPSLIAGLERRVREWESSLLFGVLDMDFRGVTGEQEGLLYNSAVLLDFRSESGMPSVSSPSEVSAYLRGESDGEGGSAPARDRRRAPQVYDKARLLPFGEYVPFRKILPFVQDFVEKQGGGAFSQGVEGRILTTAFGDIGPLICFESTHPGLARKAAHNGASLLVTITNDAWFGNTAAARQHALQSRFRAIETGRAVVRAANTGITALYLPDGSVAESLPVWEAQAASWVVPLFSHLTFQYRVGDFLGWLCLVSTGFSLLLVRGRRREGEA